MNEKSQAPAIELVGIDKKFGAVHANKNINLTVAKGSIHGIIGENGAGKSTLMSILYGFYQADQGSIQIDGKPINASGDLSTAVTMASPGARMAIELWRNGQPLRLQVDLPTLFNSNSTNDPVVQNGDVVYVDRMPQVYVYGEVQRPGALRLERGMTVLQGLATGGGLTQRGTEKGIRLHRKNAEGKVQIFQPAMDDKIIEGDVLYVRESLF